MQRTGACRWNSSSSAIPSTIGLSWRPDTSFITGGYAPDEAVPLIKAQNATLALLPSIFPETWCRTLGEAWRAGLRVVAFDIGAQAERIRGTGRGVLLPLGMPPHAINDAVLTVSGVTRRQRL